MNRIIVHLHDIEKRREQKKLQQENRILQRCDELEDAVGKVVGFWMFEDAMLWRVTSDDMKIEFADAENYETSIASGLKEFSNRCLEAAAFLDGDASEEGGQK